MDGAGLIWRVLLEVPGVLTDKVQPIVVPYLGQKWININEMHHDYK